MNRAARIGALLALVLLVCVAAVVLDQRGAFGDRAAVPTQGSPGQTAPAQGGSGGGSGSDPGYGDLK